MNWASLLGVAVIIGGGFLKCKPHEPEGRAMQSSGFGRESDALRQRAERLTTR